MLYVKHGEKKSDTSEVVPQTHLGFKYSLLVLEMPRKLAFKKLEFKNWNSRNAKEKSEEGRSDRVGWHTRDVFNSKQERVTHPTNFLYLFFREKYLHEALVGSLYELASM